MITSWSEVNIKTFKQLQKINESSIPEDKKTLQTTALLAGITMDELYNYPLKKTQELIAQTSFLYEKPKTKMLKPHYNLNGRKYNTLMDARDMTTAQYIDFKTYGADTEKYLIELLSIFLIPDGKKYGEARPLDVYADIETMGIEDALSLAVFHTALYRRLIKQMHRYLERQKPQSKVEKEMLCKAKEQLKVIITYLGSLQW